MAQRPDLSKYLDAGAQFVALTRAQARGRAKELVSQGQLAQEQAQGFVDDLVDDSRRRTDEMFDVVRREIQRQVKSLGFATKDDLARLEARLASRAGGARKTGARIPGTQTTGTRKTGAGTATKRQTAKKSARKPAKGAKKPAQRAKRAS